MSHLRVVYREPNKKTKASDEIKAWADLIEAKWRARDKKEAKAWIKTITIKQT